MREEKGWQKGGKEEGKGWKTNTGESSEKSDIQRWRKRKKTERKKEENETSGYKTSSFFLIKEGQGKKRERGRRERKGEAHESVRDWVSGEEEGERKGNVEVASCNTAFSSSLPAHCKSSFSISRLS